MDGNTQKYVCSGTVMVENNHRSISQYFFIVYIRFECTNANFCRHGGFSEIDGKSETSIVKEDGCLMRHIHSFVKFLITETYK